MLKIELYNQDASGDPAVKFATDAEIETAERLRRQLEDRYFAPSVPSSQLQGRKTKDR